MKEAAFYRAFSICDFARMEGKTITIRIVGCADFHFVAERDLFAGALKEKLAPALCVPASRLRLFAEGEELRDTERIQSDSIACAVFLPGWAEVLSPSLGKRNRSAVEMEKKGS